MVKKVLIFFPHSLKKNFGGAYTYLYYLKKAFQSTDVELSFLSDIIQFDEPVAQGRKASFFKRIAKRILPEKHIYSNRINKHLKKIKSVSFLNELQNIDYNAFDAIHFHETVDIWRFRDLLNEYRGKILLTSHSPVPYHLEFLEDVIKLDKSKISGALYHKIETIDTVAFEKADMIVAPCNEALAAYENCWPPFQQLIEKKEKTFIPTGIEASTPFTSAIVNRQKLGIPENDFVVCFNGRHHQSKGYDLVVQAAKALLHKHHDIYFLITGKKDDPHLVEHAKWVETGWTDRPEDFINASDLVIVPNRQTYFDLNVLTALSLGKVIALSETGGNNYFKQFGSKDIIFFDVEKPNSLAETILRAYATRDILTGERNKQLFQQYFTLDNFCHAYNQLYLSV